MTRIPPLLSAVVAALLLPRPVHALDATAWRNRQAVAIDRAGIVKLTLPPGTLDSARPGLEDLRVLDPSGRETPFLVEHAAPTSAAASRPPKRFGSRMSAGMTELRVETGTRTPLTGVVVATPSPFFLKSARVETSDDGESWQPRQGGAVIFRQFGAEQLELDLDRVSANWLRVIVDDARSRPIPFTGLTLLLADTAEPAPTAPLPAAHISQREEFSGETVLTIDLGARHIPLDSIAIAATDMLFTRKVTATIREMRDETAIERTLASGTLYRIAVDGLAPSTKLEFPVAATVSSRELLLHITNGDSPPLAIETVQVRQRPVWVVFAADAAGSFTLLTGNQETSAPQYDVAALADALRATPPTIAPIGAIEANPEYQAHDALAHAPLRGGPIDPTAWRLHKPVRIASGGVEQLELDVDVLAGAQRSLADVRLVRDQVQVPYVLERPSSSRSLPLTPEPVDDSKRPQLSRWRLKLPRAGVPLTRITLSSPATVFQRYVRIFESVPDPNGSSSDRDLANADWIRNPSTGPLLTLFLGAPPVTDTLFVETDNGDNPALPLDRITAGYPVARLIFSSDSSPLTLYYGNPEAGAPRYDLALVAPQLLGADKKIATLGPEVAAKPSRWTGLQALPGGVLFWGALALVVIALLAIVAKLLPKP